MKPIFNRFFNLSVFSLIFSLIFYPGFSLGGEIYKWVDEEGTVHMTDSLSSIPPQYRNQFEKKNLQTSTEPDMKSGSPKGAANEQAERAVLSLKHFEVPYQAFEGSSRRIIIQVNFNESVTAPMIMDTGSPGLMISPRLASQLGLLNAQDRNLLVMTKGIGGSVPATLAVVDTVRIGDAHAEFLPAIITDIPSKNFEGLIGMDFLANYRISIDNNNNVLHFDELSPRVDRPGGHDEAWWRSNFQTFSTLRVQWSDFLGKVESVNLTSSETDRIVRIAKNQYDEADKLYRKLERYARDNAVPITWRH